MVHLYCHRKVQHRAIPWQCPCTLLASSLLFDGLARQVWYAAAGGSLLQLKDWWSGLLSSDHHFGYHVNAAKTWLVIKQEYLAPVQRIFDGTGIQITSAGQPYLGCLLVLKISSQTTHRITFLSGFKVYHSCHQSLLHNLMLHMQFLRMASHPNGTISRLIQTSMISYLHGLEPAIRQKFLPTVILHPPSDLE